MKVAEFLKGCKTFFQIMTIGEKRLSDLVRLSKIYRGSKTSFLIMKWVRNLISINYDLWAKRLSKL